MKFTKKQMQEAVATIYGKLASGEDEADILAEMGLDAGEFAVLKQAMFDTKAAEMKAMPTEHTYVQYVIDMARNLKDIDEMIDTFKGSKQANALIGAIRTRADLLDRLIARGQEFGVIHKRPDRKEIVGGIVVADLTSVELKKMITGELAELNRMMKLYGDKDILDMEPGEIHRGPALPAAVIDVRKGPTPEDGSGEPKKKKSKFSKAKNSKRAGGRSVVKKKKVKVI